MAILVSNSNLPLQSIKLGIASVLFVIFPPINRSIRAEDFPLVWTCPLLWATRCEKISAS